MMLTNYFLLIVLPNISCFFGVFGVIGALVFSIFFVFADYDYSPKEKIEKAQRFCIKGIIISLSMMFISCFIPNQKQMIQLKLMSAISELKGVEQIPQKMIDRINDLLDMGKKDEK